MLQNIEGRSRWWLDQDRIRLVQQRVKLPGQSWESRGLRATLAIRALVSSERWDAAWKPYAAKHRREVKMVA
jgi:hypothetical protein